MPALRRFLFTAACMAACIGCGNLARHPIVVVATEEMGQNPRVVEVLGSPVTCDTAVRGTANETDGIAMLEFDVRGPKGKGVVIVEGKKTGGEWGVTQLDLQPAGDAPPLRLAADLAARTGTDTPKFDPSATPAKPSSVPPPPSEIEITLPPGPPGQ